jgi:hypothetical protein
MADNPTVVVPIRATETVDGYVQHILLEQDPEGVEGEMDINGVILKSTVDANGKNIQHVRYEPGTEPVQVIDGLVYVPGMLPFKLTKVPLETGGYRYSLIVVDEGQEIPIGFADPNTQ